MRAFGVDNRKSILHVSGVDDGPPDLVPDLNPVLGVGHFSRALLDHFSRAQRGWHLDCVRSVFAKLWRTKTAGGVNPGCSIFCCGQASRMWLSFPVLDW